MGRWIVFLIGGFVGMVMFAVLTAKSGGVPCQKEGGVSTSVTHMPVENKGGCPRGHAMVGGVCIARIG